MTWLNTVLILILAFLAIFWEGLFTGLRHWLGAQIDVLPALMVYASLSGGLATATLLAVLGGLGFDALSANPLGVSVLPLFFIGFGISLFRDLILREQFLVQLSLGFAASLFAPVFTLILLLTTGHTPLLGWGTLWQLFLMSVGGGIGAPICFEAFRLLDRVLGYHQHSTSSSFRPDREIRRGR
jgi:hypothetical protein